MDIKFLYITDILIFLIDFSILAIILSSFFKCKFKCNWTPKNSAPNSISMDERKFIHDYNNILLCIEGLLKEDKISECKEYIAKINMNTKSFRNHISTGNSIIDILINDKYQDAADHNIMMILKLCNLSNIPIDNYDMINILSNLLDNSIEACKKLESKPKQLFLKIKNTDDEFTITISNPIEEEISHDNNIISSTKNPDKFMHGIGMHSIKDAANKYNAKILISTKNQYFYYIINIKK